MMSKPAKQSGLRALVEQVSPAAFGDGEAWLALAVNIREANASNHPTREQPQTALHPSPGKGKHHVP